MSMCISALGTCSVFQAEFLLFYAFQTSLSRLHHTHSICIPMPIRTNGTPLPSGRTRHRSYGKRPGGGWHLWGKQQHRRVVRNRKCGDQHLVTRLGKVVWVMQLRPLSDLTICIYLDLYSALMPRKDRILVAPTVDFFLSLWPSGTGLFCGMRRSKSLPTAFTSSQSFQSHSFEAVWLFLEWFNTVLQHLFDVS